MTFFAAFQETYIIFAKDSAEKKLKDSWERLDPRNRYATMPTGMSAMGCYGGFFGLFKANLNYYFGFPAVPKWYEGVVDEFNSMFSNIKIEVIAVRNLKRHGVTTNFSFTDDEDSAYVMPLFKLLFNKGNYSPAATKPISYLIHHFFRQISANEGRLNTINNKIVTENFMETMIEINNLSNNYSGYRALCEEDITLEDFLLLDDPEIAEEAYMYMNDSYPRQTGLLMNLKFVAGKLDIPFKIGELVRVLNWFNQGSRDGVVVYLTRKKYIAVRVNNERAYTFPTNNLLPVSSLSKEIDRKSKFKKGNPVTTKLSARRRHDFNPFIELATVNKILIYPYVEINCNNKTYVMSEEKLKKYYPPKK